MSRLHSNDYLPTITRQVYHNAKEAVVPIATQTCHIVENKIQFLVRILLTGAQEKKKTSHNPFLPYDPKLYVTDLTDTYVCLLNKFCVVPLHILLVTKHFEPQNTLFTEKDMEAACVVLSQWEGVCFYNSCKIAGASQPHKHLQFIPFGNDTTHVAPFDHLLSSNEKVPEFPFVHRVASLQDMDWSHKDNSTKAGYLIRTYYSLLNQIISELQHYPEMHSTLNRISSTGNQQQDSNPFPYNWILTRKWMYIVPRSAEEYQGIQVNALGMIGTLLVKNQESLNNLKSIGPMQLLTRVGFPRK